MRVSIRSREPAAAQSVWRVIIQRRLDRRAALAAPQGPSLKTRGLLRATAASRASTNRQMEHRAAPTAVPDNTRQTAALQIVGHAFQESIKPRKVQLIAPHAIPWRRLTPAVELRVAVFQSPNARSPKLTSVFPPLRCHPLRAKFRLQRRHDCRHQHRHECRLMHLRQRRPQCPH